MLTRWVTTYVSVGYSRAVRTTNGRTCTKEYSWGCWNCRRCRWDYFNCLPCVTEVWKYSKLSLTCNIWIRRESKTLFRLKLSEEIDAARILVYSSCISICGSVLLSGFEKNTYSLSLSQPWCPFCVYLLSLCLRYPGSSFLKTNLLMSWLYCKIKKNKFCLFLSQNPIQNCHSKFYQERGKTKTNLLLCGRMESKRRRMHHTYVLYHLISKSD